VIRGENGTGGTAYYENIIQPANVLNLDPEGLSVQVQFTASVGGVCTIAGDFTGIDVGGINCVAPGHHP
jgi:hypothetical protein